MVLEEKVESVSKSVNYKAVCRTVFATLGLVILSEVEQLWFKKNLKQCQLIYISILSSV